jgi:hypothetical protein
MIRHRPQTARHYVVDMLRMDLYRKRDTNGAYEKTTAHLQQTLQSIDGRALTQPGLQSPTA